MQTLMSVGERQAESGPVQKLLFLLQVAVAIASATQLQQTTLEVDKPEFSLEGCISSVFSAATVSDAVYRRDCGGESLQIS